MKLGQTADLIQKADMSKFSDRVEIKEGINTHRVLNGPFLMRSVYWPTLVMEQGQQAQRMRSVLIPKAGSELLRSIADNEKEFRRMMGESDPRSQFTPTNSYMYLIFNRDEVVQEDEPIKVRVAAYKQTVYNRLKEIQAEISTVDNTKLKNGLIFMYDVQIKKTVGDRARARFTTKYTVDVDSENNQAQGHMPVVLLDMTFKEVMKVLEKNEILDQIFTKAELEAIEKCEIDLLGETKANTEEEIIHKLKDNPIFLGAKDNNTGTFLFPQNEQFMTFLKSKELPLLDSAAQTQLPAQEQETPTEAPPIQTTAEPQPENKEITVETGPTPDGKVDEVQTENGDGIIRWGAKK